MRKAIRVIVKIPVWNNRISPPHNYGTATTPRKKPDGYIKKEEILCSECDSLLEKSTLNPGFYYCWSCKDYKVEPLLDETGEA